MVYVHYTVFYLHYTVVYVNYTVFYVHYIFLNVNYTGFYVHYTVLFCTLHSILCTLHVHSVLCRLHSPYIPHQTANCTANEVTTLLIAKCTLQLTFFRTWAEGFLRTLNVTPWRKTIWVWQILIFFIMFKKWIGFV